VTAAEFMAACESEIMKSWGAASLVVSANCLIVAYDVGRLAAMQYFADSYVTNLRKHIETLGTPVCARDIDSLTDIQTFLIFLRVSGIIRDTASVSYPGVCAA